MCTMAAASTSVAVRKREEIADWNNYLEEDGDFGLVKKRNPKQESSTRAKLDPDLWGRLSDSLTEKIVAKLPFKALFRVASLSKTWSLAFRTPSFQREVLRSSFLGWASYSPLFLNEKQQLLGFDGKSQLWHRLPTRLNRPEASGQSWRLESSGGSLLCWTSGRLDYLGKGYNIHVSNPLNGSWKQLPSPPKTGACGPILHMVCEGDDAYQVILISLNNMRGRVNMCIFDSSSESWIVTSHGDKGPEMEWGGSMLVNGVIYMLLGRRCDGCDFVSFHVRDRIWNVLPFVQEDVDNRSALSPFTGPRVMELHGVSFSQLVVCGSDTMLVVQCWLGSDDDEDFQEGIALFKVEPELGVAYRLTTAPREMRTVGRVHGAVGQGDCLYIFGRYPSSLTIRYNMKTQEWNWAAVDILSPDPEADLPTGYESRRLRCGSLLRVVSHLDKTHGWIQSKYEPSWNPFLEV